MKIINSIGCAKITSYRYLTFITAVIIAVTLKMPIPFISWIDFPYQDKIIHFTLIGLLTLPMNQLLNFRTFEFKQRLIPTATVALVIFITVEEFSQLFIAHRNFDLVDLLANYSGIAVCQYLIYKYIPKAKAS